MSEAPNEPANNIQSAAASFYDEPVAKPAAPAPVAEPAKAPAQAPATPKAAPVQQPTPTQTPNQSAKPVEPSPKVDDKPPTVVEQPNAKAPPENYALKLPDNSPLESTRLDEIAAEAKAEGLSNEDAQRLVEREHKTMVSMIGAHNARVDQWKAELENDPVIGGVNAKQNLELAHRMIARYGSPSLLRQLDVSGFGNHPELVKMMVKIGNESGEDRLVVGGAKAPTQSLDAASTLFPEHS